MLSRPGTASRGYRGGRLPERPARDGDALQHGFGGATVELQRSGRRWAEIDLPAGGVGNAASGQRQAVARYTRRRNGLRTLGTLSPPAAHSSFLTLCWRRESRANSSLKPRNSLLAGKIQLERVHVGGQGIKASTRGEGAMKKTEDQPHAPSLSGSVSPDTVRNTGPKWMGCRLSHHAGSPR
jgi:hypothetical protein